VAVVVGSGIMGSKLSADIGVVLLINALSTILALGLLILLLTPISGAQLNPVVSLSLVFMKSAKVRDAAPISLAQFAGAIGGAMAANAMFDLKVVQFAQMQRSTYGSFLGEVIATAGLILIILTLISRKQEKLLPIAVSAWIGSAFFFTSSTSFANPAVTVGRVFSNTFAGIAPESVLPFIFAQIIGAMIGIAISKGVSRV
jgi:glycerol uptake facilitator-like aquaporin